ncbi:MAG TPA: hypothetical protein VKA79_00655, partial [Aestuariivirgaceae bacterium]|nr:hypothetical protein [Aestuariivirgaceae bacterium]
WGSEAKAGGRNFYLHCIFALLRVMRGLDPRICRWHEIAGSSPATTNKDQVRWLDFTEMTMTTDASAR